MAWTEQLRSGNYRGIYRDQHGKRRSAGSHPTRKRAQDAATAAEVDAQRRTWRNPDAGNIKTAQWITEWWPTRPVEPSTLARDESRLNTRVLPRWGHVTLDEITRHDVKAWAAELTQSGLSRATVQRCVHLLSAALTGAVDAELIPANPAARLRLPQPDNQRERYLTREEASLLLNTLKGQEKAIVAMLLGTGLRWGELAGAHIEHYDPKSATYRVTKVHDNRSREIRDYPKGKKRRTVPVPPWVQAELTNVIGKRRSGLIFTTATGTALDNGNFVRRTLTPALLHTGIEDVTPHTFRHTYASWLIQEGVSLAEVGKLLGHVSPQTTARYAHLLQEASQQVIDALADPWGTTKNDKEIGQARGANVGQFRATRRSTALRRTNSRKPRLPSNSKEIGA